MKNLFTVILLFFISIQSFAQSRTAGKMVLPSGYENYDSLRFALFDLNEAVLRAGFQASNDSADRIMQTFEEGYGDVHDTYRIAGKRKGYMGWTGTDYICA